MGSCNWVNIQSLKVRVLCSLSWLLISKFSHFFSYQPKRTQPGFTFYFAPELFFNHFPPSRDHWWTTRDSGDWIFCGGCAWWEHEGWNMLLCRSFNQVQSQITSRCLRAPCSAGPNRAHWLYVKENSRPEMWWRLQLWKDEATGAFVYRRLKRPTGSSSTFFHLSDALALVFLVIVMLSIPF